MSKNANFMAPIAWSRDSRTTCAVALVELFTEMGAAKGPDLDTALHAWTLPAFNYYIDNHVPEPLRQDARWAAIAHIYRRCKEERRLGTIFQFPECSSAGPRDRVTQHLDGQAGVYEKENGPVTAFVCTSLSLGGDYTTTLVPEEELTFEKILQLAGAPYGHMETPEEDGYDWREIDVTYWELTTNAEYEKFRSAFYLEVGDDEDATLEIRPITQPQQTFLQELLSSPNLPYLPGRAMRWLHTHGPEVHEAVIAGFEYGNRMVGQETLYRERNVEDAVDRCIALLRELPADRAKIFLTLAGTWQGELEELAEHTRSISA